MKKLSLFLLFLIALCIPSVGQTFKVTNVSTTSMMSQKDINQLHKLKGAEITLTFTDNDVRISVPDGNGGFKSELLQKKAKIFIERALFMEIQITGIVMLKLN